MDVVSRGAVGPPNHTDAPTAVCDGCGAPLAPDQRYCLACGRPCSPVRLAFLDVLQAEHQTASASLLGALPPGGYQLPPDPPGLLGSLRRYSGLFGLLGVLLASLLIGLLVGHWLTAGSGGAPGKQVIELKGLPGALASAPAAGTSTGSGSGSSTDSTSPSHGSSSGSSSSQSHSSPASSKAEEAAEAKEVTTTKALPAAQKTSATKLEKLAHTTGKQHAKEVAALGNEPIETGGH